MNAVIRANAKAIAALVVALLAALLARGGLSLSPDLTFYLVSVVTAVVVWAVPNKPKGSEVIPYTIDARGWFSNVNGRVVNVRNLTQRLPGSAMPWAFTHPIGILWHYTDGFNGDISGSMVANNFITAQMSIGRDGQIYQYADIFTAHWHAFAASKWGIGVEHEAHPPDTMTTDVQLQASAELFACIIDAVKIHFGNDIPVVHITGCDLTKPGLKEHKDGVGCSWDPNGHSDALIGWTWPQYTAAVNAALTAGGDDLSILSDDEQQKLQGLLRRFQKQGPPDAASPAKVKEGFTFTDAVLDEANANPKPTQGGFVKHTHKSDGGTPA